MLCDLCVRPFQSRGRQRVGLVSDRFRHTQVHTNTMEPHFHDTRAPIRLGNVLYAKNVRIAHINIGSITRKSVHQRRVLKRRTWFGPFGGSLSCTNLIFSVETKQEVQDGGVTLLKHVAPRVMQNGRPPRSDDSAYCVRIFLVVSRAIICSGAMLLVRYMSMNASSISSTLLSTCADGPTPRSQA
jgi:hypothetical protein